MKENPRIRDRRAKSILSKVAPLYTTIIHKKYTNNYWALIKGPLDKQFILVAISDGKVVFRELGEEIHRFKDEIPREMYYSTTNYLKGLK